MARTGQAADSVFRRARAVCLCCLPALLLAATAISSAGCASSKGAEKRRRPGQTDLRIKSFRIEGAESFSERAIKGGLATREDPGIWTAFSWLPLVKAKRQYFNYLEWKRDLERIRTFYQSRGYFNAQIVRETIVRKPKRGIVNLHLQVSEGKPVRVSQMTVEGLDPVSSYDEKSMLRGLPLEKGQVFSESEYLDSKSRILSRLERQGYAYADVNGRAYIVPGKAEARIRFIADPGPQAVFGDVEIEGLTSVPEKYVRQALEFEPGDPYSSEAVQETQESIYELEVFSLVSVLPAHQAKESLIAEELPEDADRQADMKPSEAPATTPGGGDDAPGPLGISELLNKAQADAEKRIRLDPRVPIVVRLKEARVWNVRVGAGFAIESNRQDVHGIVNISSKNVFGGLQTLEFSNTAGYAWAPGFLLVEREQAANQGLILDSRLEFTQPWFGSQDTTIRLTPSVEHDVRIGYTLWNPAARIGVDRTFFDHLDAGVGYRISYFNFNNIDPNLAEDTPLGLDFQPEFILESFEQSVALDYRNNPLDPTSGFRTQLTLQEAGNYVFGGEFNYLKSILSAEGYIPFDLFTKMVLGLRAEMGTIYNIEPVETEGGDVETQRVPTTSRLYAGGKNSIRSFGQRSLSLYKGTVPVGGLTGAEATVEPRFRLVPNLADLGDLWGAVFFDAATVLKGQFLFQTPANRSLALGVESPSNIIDSMLYGAGVGVWWVTPIGPVRADFAYTLSSLDDPRFRQCANQDFPETGNPSCDKVPIGEDPIQEKLLRFNFLIGIGHSF